MGSHSEPQNSAPSNAANNFGVHEQTSFQPSASDRFTSNTAEPSVSTGAALDQYQIISQKAVTHPVAGTDDKGPESSEPDAPEFHGQGEIFSNDTSLLFSEWCRISSLPGLNDAACATYVQQLHRNVLSRAADMPDNFFRLLLEHVVSQQCHQHEDPPSFHDIDRYTDLVFSILKFYHADQGLNKLSLLSKVLEVIVTFIIRDVKEKKKSFRPKPFSRLFINFFIHIDTLESIIEDTNFEVLKAISNSLRSLQPAKVPAFGLSWLELISHKDFMPKLLAANDQNRWPYFLNLLVDFLRFMEPSFRTPEQKEPVNLLYEETHRVLLVLLEDFPEFLCYYHFSLCDAIPPQCVELRNAILGAIPCNMRNPDHNTANSKVNLYAEMNQPPCILSEFDASLKASKMKSEVDEYLTTRQKDLPFLSQLKNKLLLRKREAKRSGTRYNVPLINSLVLYVGTKAIEQLYPSTAPHSTSEAKGAPLTVFFAASALDIFQTLILDLDTEGRYAFFNAVANNLRYPNNHTNYFKFILLYFFRKINQEEAIQAQITRVLLGCLITHRPHPWGVLVTFLDLTRDPKYKFWSLNFTKRDPEIKRIFNLVTSYRVSPNPVEDDVGTSGMVPEKMP